MIAIVDYGVGNLFSLRSSLRYLGLGAEVTADADALRRAERIILPAASPPEPVRCWAPLPTPGSGWTIPA